MILLFCSGGLSSVNRPVSFCRAFVVLVRQSGNAVHQVTNGCAAQQFEEGRYLCHHIDNIASETAGSEAATIGPIATASRNNRDFIDLAQRLSNSTDNFGHACEEFIKYRSLVIFVVGRSFDLHRFSFRFTFSTDNFSFGKTASTDNFSFSETTSAGGFRFTHALCFSSVGLTLRFQDNALALGFGHGFDAAALSFGSFLDRRL